MFCSNPGFYPPRPPPGSASNILPEHNRHPVMMTSSNTPLRAADTPSHSLQVSDAQHQHQPLHFITHTHTEHPPPPPMSQGKQQRWREREQRVSRPPGPAESACQLGKARWKQSHMMAARVVAKGRWCSRCRPSRLLVSQSRWRGGWGGGGGRSAAMGWCGNGQTEKSEQAAAASELLEGSGGNSQLPCKHRPSTQSTNLIMGGVVPPPDDTDTSLTSSAPPLPPHLSSAHSHWLS